MIDIKRGTPAHEGYNAAVTYFRLGDQRDEPTCPYAHDTPEFSDWQEGYQTAIKDVTVLEEMGARI